MLKGICLLFPTAAAISVFASGIIVGTGGVSPEDALARIREARSRGETGPRTVRIKGNVVLRKPLVLKPEDSGLRFVGEGEDATFTGGEPLVGWRDAGDGTWTCPAPRRADGSPVLFEQLWTNGRRAGRSVYPKDGFLSFKSAGQKKLPAGGRFGFLNSFEFEKKLPATERTNWAAAKLVVISKWSCSRQVITSYDAATGLFTLETDEYQVSAKRWDERKEKQLVRLENIDFGFTDPGDWLYDEKAGLIRYRPRPGETLSALTAVAPTTGLRELIRLEGDPDGRSYVRNVVFSGVGFEATAGQNDYPSASDGRVRVNGRQAAFLSPAAVTLEAARGVRFENCRFRHTGGYALRIADGSMSNAVVRCVMEDLGAGGITAGARERNPDHYMADKRLSRLDAHLPCPEVYDFSARAVAFIEVSDCLIANAGKVNAEGVGILFTNISDSKITHNDIRDILYSGVSVGWSWGYRGSVSQRNEISFNRISDLGSGIMSDLAGIYTLGTSHGTVISNNVIARVKAHHYGGWGIYNDEGSEGIVMENNLVHDTFDGGYHLHYGRNNIVRNNIFAYSDRDQIAISKAENHLSAAFLNNIVLWSRRKNGEDHAFLKYEGLAAGKAKAFFIGNLWFNEAGATFFRKWQSFPVWQREGNDIVGARTNPMFVDAAKRDFRLRPGSPALASGFRPWDVSDAGRRPRRPAK